MATLGIFPLKVSFGLIEPKRAKNLGNIMSGKADEEFLGQPYLGISEKRWRCTRLLGKL